MHKKNRKTQYHRIFFPPKSLAKCVVVSVIARQKPNLLKQVLCIQTACDRQSQKPGGGRKGGLVCRPPLTLWLLCLLSLLRRNLNAIKETQCCFLSPLITSCYGLALFNCLLVNKPSCLPVLIRGEFLHQPPPTPIHPQPIPAVLALPGPPARRRNAALLKGITSSIHVKSSRCDSQSSV